VSPLPEKRKRPRAKLARGLISTGRLAVFNVEQVSLNRHVPGLLKEQSKKPAPNSAGFLKISLAV
jgi:hypothetical protein